MEPSYTTNAIEALSRLRSDVFYGGIRDRIVSGMRSAIKYRLPVNAELVTNPVEVSESILGAYRLPFDKIICEFETDMPPSGKYGTVSASKIVTFAEHIDDLKAYALSMGIAGPPSGDGYFLHSSCLTYAGWVPSHFAALVPYKSDMSAPKGWSKIAMCCFDLGGEAKRQADLMGVKLSQIDMVNEYYLDATAVLNVAVCSMCENVENEIVKRPKHTNISRKKKGKEPFYEYRVLKVKGEQAGSGGGGGLRGAGVRLHMRRGHIRKLSSGKMTWVRHCIVGDKSRGVVMKEYDLT